MSNLAIIPARGGSKRIPGKNIRFLSGKPIIAYSLEAALKSRLFDEVMVSTDDPVISCVALQYGAKVPFMRSKKNSDDYATIAEVILEVINQYEKTEKKFDIICCIFPTAPLITVNHITEAYSKLINENFDSVCSVVKFSHPILRALEITKEQKLQMIWPDHLNYRSQDMNPAYHDAGSFVWVKKQAFLHERTLLCGNGGAVILTEPEVQDIDTESDWQIAEMKYKLMNQIL